MNDNRNHDRDPMAEALRATLRERARQAPSGDLLAERIIHAADRASAGSPRRRGWRTWGLPLIAAGAVAAVVGAVVGIESYHSGSRTPVAEGSAVSTVPTPHSKASSSATSAPALPGPTVATESLRAVPSVLRGVHVLDLTFTGTDAGVALASADCLNGSGRRCTAMLRTTDGATWTSMGGEIFDVTGVDNCRDGCVQNVRFATAKVGYVYGPKALFMTTDGGRHWSPQPGEGAVALESLNETVVRVTSTGTGCPGWCNIGVATAPNGSANWTSVSLPVAGVNSDQTPVLVRGGSDAYLLVSRNPAGGASNATSTLFVSHDNGQSWRSVGEPCPQVGGEADSSAVTADGSGQVSVLCTTRQAPQRSFVATSTQAGASGTFAAQAGTVPSAQTQSTLLTGDPATVLVVAGAGLSRSVDGGLSWQPVATVTGSVSFVGFESGTVGRAVTGGSTIWTTRDAGQTWTPTPVAVVR